MSEENDQQQESVPVGQDLTDFIARLSERRQPRERKKHKDHVRWSEGEVSLLVDEVATLRLLDIKPSLMSLFQQAQAVVLSEDRRRDIKDMAKLPTDFLQRVEEKIRHLTEPMPAVVAAVQPAPVPQPAPALTLVEMGLGFLGGLTDLVERLEAALKAIPVPSAAPVASEPVQPSMSLLEPVMAMPTPTLAPTERIGASGSDSNGQHQLRISSGTVTLEMEREEEQEVKKFQPLLPLPPVLIPLPLPDADEAAERRRKKLPVITVIGLLNRQAEELRQRCKKIKADLRFIQTDRSPYIPSNTDEVLLFTKWLPHEWQSTAFAELPRSKVHLHPGGISEAVNLLQRLVEARYPG